MSICFIVYNCLCTNEMVILHCASFSLQLAPCEPGTFSATGLSPCKKCPTGSYQNASRASFCFYCNFGLITESEGSITKDDCKCPNGTFWQNCSKNCTCVNGGRCRIDGKCDCPRGWTGTDCSQPSFLQNHFLQSAKIHIW
jgi:hypothetical protein